MPHEPMLLLAYHNSLQQSITESNVNNTGSQ